jgi:transcriptional regulator with XRE-family HTH domain
MLTTSQLLDAAKLAQNIGSEYRFARVLGVADNTLYNYRHGRTPDDERALKLAKMAGFDIGYALICMAAERTKDAEARASFLVAAAALEKAFPGQTVDILRLQLRTPDRLKTPINKGSATMAKGSEEYTS